MGGTPGDNAGDFSEARRGLFRAVFEDRDAATALKVVHSLAAGRPCAVACAAALGVLAKRKGDLFPDVGPTHPGGDAPPDLAAGLLKGVGDDVSAVDWKLGARLLLLGDDADGYRRQRPGQHTHGCEIAANLKRPLPLSVVSRSLQRPR